jgi:hypothetical protein
LTFVPLGNASAIDDEDKADGDDDPHTALILQHRPYSVGA